MMIVYTLDSKGGVMLENLILLCLILGLCVGAVGVSVLISSLIEDSERKQRKKMRGAYDYKDNH